MQLTPSQLSALRLASHTAIIANAGSGKTAVLVERYLKILETFPELHPRNIVAITFTDASARDLKKKIVDALNERLENCETGKRRDRLLEIRRQVGGAYISTIHSFCIQLLRTYPVEANVDASFTILTSPEDQLLREECLRAAFYDILNKAYTIEDSSEGALLPVFRLFGRRKVALLIHSFLGSRFRLNDLKSSLYSQNDKEILNYWKNTLDNILKKEIIDKIDISFFERLLQDKTKKGTHRQNADEALSNYLYSKKIGEKVKNYSALINSFFTKDYTLTGRLFSSETKEAFQNEAIAVVGPYAKYFDLINSYIESSNNISKTTLYLDYTRQLLEIFTRVLSAYAEQKINYSFLDYDDVLEKALNLVQIPEIQAELVKRFSYILIDEYQDTDTAQYSIARALTGNFHNSNRLTIVGDPKQSIYSFRNADLELFQETIREISATHTQDSPVILSESFRILSYPLAFINKVSEYLFDDNSPDRTENKFTPLVEGRNESSTGTIELILPLPLEEQHSYSQDANDNEPVEDQNTTNEVKLITLKIKQIIADNSGKYFLPEKHQGAIIHRPPHYSDIAILLRSRTNQSNIESSLRRNNIPFVTYGGKGFYAKAEIIDITNYLRFLINPNDDIALAGILRSPYFGLSDVNLYRLAPERSSVTNLWQRLSLHIMTGNDQYITRAYEQLSDNLQLVGRVSTQFLLQKIITESGIYGTLQSLPDGNQKIANLEKYIRFALAFGNEGYSGTFDFIERIALLMERDEMEAQAEPQKDQNAVHILTIHNAKGLEFPIVFLPYLHSNLIGGDHRTIWNSLDKHLGIGVDLPEQISKMPIVELIKIRSREKELEEEKRIFYVAMTRARDHLILSTSPKKTYNHTRIGWVFNALSFDPTQIDNSSIVLDTAIEHYRPEGNFIDFNTVNIPIIRRNSDILPAGEQTIEAIERHSMVEFNLEDVSPSESIGRYSPSQLLTYLECPTKYYLRYQLGLPEDDKLPYYNEADILAENTQGTLFGQIMHKVLEKANAFVNTEFIDIELLHDAYELVCNDLHISKIEQKKFIHRVRTEIQNVFSSALGKQSLRSSEYYTELSIRSKLRTGQMLSGIIDRLFRDDNGNWNILDYKTDVRESMQKKQRYEFQLQFYAYLVSLLYGQAVVKAHVLYTHSGNSLSFAFSQKDFAHTEKLLQTLVDEIRTQKKLKSLVEIERNLSHCPECAYFERTKNLCLAGAGKETTPFQTELLYTDSLF